MNRGQTPIKNPFKPITQSITLIFYIQKAIGPVSLHPAKKNLNYRTVFRIADFGVPVLGNLAHDLFFRYADLQDVVVLEVNTFHNYRSRCWITHCRTYPVLRRKF